MIDLILRYRAIKLFIKTCYIENEPDKLYDFLMDIQTEDEFSSRLN